VGIRHDGKHLDTLAECYAAVGDRKRAIETEDVALTFVNGTALSLVLKQHRNRFESGKGESAEVVQARLKTADLWKRMKTLDQLAPQIEDPERKAAVDARWLARKALWKAQQELEDALRATCEGSAERARLAVARVRVNSQGNLTDPVLLLEDTAPSALRTCLLRELATRTLPAQNSFTPPIMLTVRFDRAL